MDSPQKPLPELEQPNHPPRSECKEAHFHLFTIQKFKKMVTVTGFIERTRKDATKFIALEISGGLELVQSNNTGKFYGTVKKTSIPCTFDENLAKTLIGTQMPGSIVRVTVDPYNYLNKKTGEVIQLQHSYSYQPEGSMELIGQTQVSELAMA